MRKIRKLLSKSETFKVLEKEVLDMGYKYIGDVVDKKSIANTDPENKEIRVNSDLIPEEAAISYAYELQNAKNGAKYNKIFSDARSGKIKNAKEFSDKIMQHEFEALETEAVIAIEADIEKHGNQDVIKIVKETEDPAKRAKKINKWADSNGLIKGMKPSAYYEKMYNDNFSKLP